MALIGMPGGQELLIIALVLLVLFGGAKIPALMKGMGQGIREFRKELKSGDGEADDAKTAEKRSGEEGPGEPR